jgi:hypothetical protein
VAFLVRLHLLDKPHLPPIPRGRDQIATVIAAARSQNYLIKSSPFVRAGDNLFQLARGYLEQEVGVLGELPNNLIPRRGDANKLCPLRNNGHYVGHNWFRNSLLHGQDRKPGATRLVANETDLRSPGVGGFVGTWPCMMVPR